MLNLITDVPGIRVGNAEDSRIATGVTVAVFDRPATASVSIRGGAPGSRDVTLLDTDMTAEKVDAIVLSGGSAFGLDAAGGVQNVLQQQGRGYAIGNVTVPLVPQAIVFDLLNGGNKKWGNTPPYWQLGKQAAHSLSRDFPLGTTGGGYGATTANFKGGLGSASAITASGFTVGALVIVNAIGRVTVGDGPHFWSAPVENGQEFGGFGYPAHFKPSSLSMGIKGHQPATTIAIVATDAILTKAQAKRMAIMADDGMARAIRPAHAAMDGDTVFAAATGHIPLGDPLFHLTEIGLAAADCLARAVARGVFEATALPFDNALPSWKDRHSRA